METLKELLATNALSGRSTAVVFFDCDDFKYVNDTWGHHAGDVLLRDIASRLPDRLGHTDVLARQGGDEFVALSSMRNLTEGVALAEQVEKFFGEPLRILPGRVHTLTSSIGVAVAGPGRATTTEELLGEADLAMYEAKAGGRGRIVVFDADLARQSRTRASVGDRLEGPVCRDVFGLELQPIMGGRSYGCVIGWEALARWHDAELGTVPPDVFVPLAEQLGLIGDLGEAVLRRACRDLARLRRSLRRDDLAVFVNVSPAQLLRPDFAATVRDALESAGLPGRCRRLEVTETMLVDKGPAVLGALQDLSRSGVSICFDDFGTGYASSATLLRLSIDCVKLDRSLIRRLDVDAEAPRQIRAVIDLIDSLGIPRSSPRVSRRRSKNVSCSSSAARWCRAGATGGRRRRSRRLPPTCRRCPDRLRAVRTARVPAALTDVQVGSSPARLAAAQLLGSRRARPRAPRW